MKLALVGVLVVLFALPASAADPADEVRLAEIAFAKAFADRDREQFFSLVADDATFFGSDTQRGRAAVVERWSRYLQAPEAPFSWGPERVAVNAAGTIGLSTGPVFSSRGVYGGNYISTWVKQADGSWKILFDSAGPSSPAFANDLVAVEEGFVTADDGVKLRYRKAGRGPLTVVVPGDFMLHDDFAGLADIATVVTYDPRNRGRSERMKEVGAMTVQHDVRDLEAVRKHVKADRIVPVGYSYLGKMVALYALEHPDRVARLIQLGPSPMSSETDYPAELKQGYEDMGASVEDLARWQEMQKAGAAKSAPREFCEAQWRVFQFLLVGNPKRASRIRVTCDLENEWPVNLGAHLEPLMQSLAKTPLTAEKLKALKVPVLTIHGTKDRNAPYGSGREWAGSLPDARLVTVEGAGHQSWADDPATVFAAIRGFLRGDAPLGAER